MYFSGAEVRRTTTVRPLRVVSDFVAERMPEALAMSDEAFRCELAAVATTVSADDYRTNLAVSDDQLPLACLDLAMLKQACGHTGTEMPPALDLLFTRLCDRGRRLATMLYEDCVVNNPVESDPRLFVGGSVGAYERDFLQLHRHIEAALDDIIEQLQALPAASDRRTAISVCDTALGRVTDCFKQFRQMPTDVFDRFRRFYSSPKGEHHLGVGGRFSGTIATLRLLLDGKRIAREMPSYLHELLDHAPYYPSCHRPRLVAALEDALVDDVCFADALCDSDAEAHALIARLRAFLDTCMGIHYRLVKKFVLDREPS